MSDPELRMADSAAEHRNDDPALSPSPGGGLNPLAPAGAPFFDPVLEVIERAARDPTVHIEKMQQLFALRERLDATRASLAYAEAFAALGPDLPVIDRNGRIVVYSKSDREKPGGVPAGARPIQQTPFAQFDDILEALRKPLHAHGFSIRYEFETTGEGKLIVKAILRHRLGHSESASSPPLKHDTTGSKNDIQAVGSALSYGMRYATRGVVPYVSHAPQDADDDGKAAGETRIEADDVAYVEQLLRDTDSDVPRFLETIGAPSVAELNIAQYKRSIALLNEKKRRAARGAA